MPPSLPTPTRRNSTKNQFVAIPTKGLRPADRGLWLGGRGKGCKRREGDGKENEVSYTKYYSLPAREFASGDKKWWQQQRTATNPLGKNLLCYTGTGRMCELPEDRKAVSIEVESTLPFAALRWPPTRGAVEAEQQLWIELGGSRNVGKLSRETKHKTQYRPPVKCLNNALSLNSFQALGVSVWQGKGVQFAV